MDPFDASLEPAPTTLLGPLEQQIHHAVWMRGSGTVREVLQDPGIWQRYSTILTTMDRLFRKGLLGRIAEGKAYRYWVRCSPEELQRRTTVSGLRRLLRTEDAALHLSYFVEAVGAEDGKLLDELQTLVERRRAELLLKRGEK